MIERLLQTWRTLAAREKRMVGAALGVLVIALAYLLLFEPAWKGRGELRDELPALRGQLAQMSALGAEAGRLRSAPQGADSPQAMQASLEASVQSAGLAGALTKLERSGELFDLRFASVAHATWLAWLDTTVRETQLRVVDLSVTREAVPGLVSVRLVMEFPRRKGR